VFREQMRYLATRGYYTAPLSTVLGWKGHAPQTARRPVVITFDDGYSDNVENALPVLREFGFTAAVFPVLDLGRRVNWWDATRAMRAPLLSPVEMRTLEAAGIELGSHTVTHPRLTGASDVQLAEELARSREVLASIVARPLPVLAYPYGEVNARVKRAARQAGYSAGLAVNSGPLELRADPFEIRRQCVANCSTDAYMALKLSGAQRLYSWSKWKVRAGLDSVKRWMPERRALAGGRG
jgi:peptidoglycan/xylan/chitin deacetylase (PgdA/CDA1 family)